METKPESACKAVPPLRLEWIEAGSLTENPLNWRRHSQEQLESIRELLQEAPDCKACMVVVEASE